MLTTYTHCLQTHFKYKNGYCTLSQPVLREKTILKKKQKNHILTYSEHKTGFKTICMQNNYG